MKTLLNLLPEEKKEYIEKHLHFRFLLWQLFLLFVLEVFCLSIFISIYLILDFQHKSLEAIGENSAITPQTEVRKLNEYERKFQETNGLVEVVEKMERSHLYFSRVFTLLDTVIPDGILVEHLETREYTVSLSGKAAKREDLLLFDKKLKDATECIANVNIPVSNLFSQRDIDFQVDFSLLPECLKSSESAAISKEKESL